MRRYETFVIMDPDLSQDQRDQVTQRVEDLVTQMDGFLVFADDWGERKLAYDIKKRPRGYYVRFDYCGLSPLVNEIERFFRIDDRVLKYMTVLLDKAADLDKIKEEKADAESKAATEAAQVEAPPPMETEPAADTPVEDQPAVEAAETVEDSAAVEESTPVEERKQENVAPAADESDSATETTPSKKPEEA